MVEVKILREAENPLLKRKEILFEAVHPNSQTPSVFQIRELISALKATPIETVYVLGLKGASGRHFTRGEAHIYHSAEDAWIEPLHVKIANLPPQEKKQKKEELKKRRMEAKAIARGGKK